MLSLQSKKKERDIIFRLVIYGISKLEERRKEMSLFLYESRVLFCQLDGFLLLSEKYLFVV